MEKNNQLRNLKIIFLILLGAILIVLWFDHMRKKIDVGYPLDKIKMTIDGWEGFNFEPGKHQSEWVDQGDMLIRGYRKEEKLINMVAIQERGDRHRVHSPADCHSGAGWVVLEKKGVKLGWDKRKSAKRMLVVKEGVHRIVYYWFTNGEDQCASFKWHLALFLKDVIFEGSIRSWVCFQISADITGSSEETDEMLKHFIYKVFN